MKNISIVVLIVLLGVVVMFVLKEYQVKKEPGGNGIWASLLSLLGISARTTTIPLPMEQKEIEAPLVRAPYMKYIEELLRGRLI